MEIMHSDGSFRLAMILSSEYLLFQFPTSLPLHFAIVDLHDTAQAALLSARDLDVACQEVFPSDAQRCGG